MYTLLMSVYAGERPDHLNAALGSVYEAPSREGLDEIVLVWDGPLSDSLAAVIAHWRDRLPIRDIPLERNVGLARALTHGLQYVMSPWVMRFDSDDLCMPSRFAVQHSLMASGKWDLIGAQIGEFSKDSASPHQWRRVPSKHQDILSYSRSRNPFNHMTVCFRTELARSVGGYPKLLFMEDYALWARMLRVGARAFNSPDVLVHARVGAGMYARRGGWTYLKCEVHLQRYLVDIGHKSFWEAVRDGFARSTVFMCPTPVRRRIYERLLRRAQ